MNSLKYVVVSLIFFVGFYEHNLCGMFGMGKVLPMTKLEMQLIKERALRLGQRKLSVLALDENAQRKKEETQENKLCFVSTKSSLYKNKGLKKKINIINAKMDDLLEAYFERNTKPFDVREKRKQERVLLVLALSDVLERIKM